MIFFLYKILLEKWTYVKIITSPRKDKDGSLIQPAIQRGHQQILSVQCIYRMAIFKSKTGNKIQVTKYYGMR